MMSDTDNQSSHPVTGIEGSNITYGSRSPIVIGNNNVINITEQAGNNTFDARCSASSLLVENAKLTAERDALAAEVERLHRILQQLLPPRG